MLRRITILVVAVLALGVVACGNEEEAAPPGGQVPGEAGPPAETAPEDLVEELSEAGPPYNLSEVEAALERAGLNINRLAYSLAGEDQATGLVREIDVPVLQAARYQEARTTDKFDLLVFPSEQAARQAIPQLRETDVVEGGGMIVGGENVLAVADRRFDDEPLSTVQQVLRDLPPNPADDGTTTAGS